MKVEYERPYSSRVAGGAAPARRTQGQCQARITALSAFRRPGHGPSGGPSPSPARAAGCQLLAAAGPGPGAAGRRSGPGRAADHPTPGRPSRTWAGSLPAERVESPAAPPGLGPGLARPRRRPGGPGARPDGAGNTNLKRLKAPPQVQVPVNGLIAPSRPGNGPKPATRCPPLPPRALGLGPSRVSDVAA